MADDIVKQLARVDIFATMPEKHLKRLAGMTRERTFAPGRSIAHEGESEPLAAFHLIAEGSAEVSTNGHAVRTLGPGDYFGEISMIDGKARSVSVTATDEMRTLTIPHVVFEDLLEHEPTVAIGLLKVLCSRIRDLESR